MTGSTKVLPAMVFNELIKKEWMTNIKKIFNLTCRVSKAVLAGPPNLYSCKALFEVNRHVGWIIKTFYLYIQKVN